MKPLKKLIVFLCLISLFTGMLSQTITEQSTEADYLEGWDSKDPDGARRIDTSSGWIAYMGTFEVKSNMTKITFPYMKRDGESVTLTASRYGTGASWRDVYAGEGGNIFCYCHSETGDECLKKHPLDWVSYTTTATYNFHIYDTVVLQDGQYWWKTKVSTDPMEEADLPYRSRYILDIKGADAAIKKWDEERAGQPIGGNSSSGSQLFGDGTGAWRWVVVGGDISYTITYEPNGGTWKDGSSKSRSETITNVTSASVKYSGGDLKAPKGKVFIGWKVSGSCYQSGSVIQGGKLTEISSDITLTAQWDGDTPPPTNTPTPPDEPGSNYVRYYTNGGEWTSGGKSYRQTKIGEKTEWSAEYGAGDLIPPEDMIFDCWEISGNCNEAGKKGTKVTGVNGTANFSAVWKPGPTKIPPTPTPPSAGVVYIGNGATGGSTPSDIQEYGGTFTVRSNGFTRMGYHYLKWNTTSDGKGKDYFAGDSISIYASTTSSYEYLFAQWEGNNTIVHFDYNTTNLINPSSMSKGAYGDSLTGGQSIEYYNDASDPDKFVTVTTAPDEKVVKLAEPYGQLPNPSIAGYDFVGWSNMLDFYGGFVTSSTLVWNWEIHNLYAYWKPKVYEITFDYNFDYGVTSPTYYKNKTFDGEKAKETYGTRIGQGTNDMLPEPQREGYIFRGWYTEETSNNGSGIIMRDGDIYDIPNDTTLYARWSPVIVDVVYANVTTPRPTGRAAYGMPMGEAASSTPMPVRIGYDFKNWTEKLSPLSAVVTESTISRYTVEPTYLYAQWKAQTYSVLLDYMWTWKREADLPMRDGVSVSIYAAPEYVRATYDDRYPSLPVPSREGYTFGGWWATDDKGVSYRVVSNVTLVTIPHNHTLKAMWVPDIVTVYYDYNNYSDVMRRYWSMNDLTLMQYYR